MLLAIGLTPHGRSERDFFVMISITLGEIIGVYELAGTHGQVQEFVVEFLEGGPILIEIEIPHGS